MYAVERLPQGSRYLYSLLGAKELLHRYLEAKSILYRYPVPLGL